MLLEKSWHERWLAPFVEGERKDLHAEEAMYAIGVDYHKAYSQLTILDAAGRVVRAGRIANTPEAVRDE
jgi:hypothetical protein